jgi:predicted signal transduction protein with EAL and GGDEF domain
MKFMVATAPDGLAGVRNRALLLLGFAGAFRWSELVALDISDATENETGLLVTIRRGKTDQEAEGRSTNDLFGRIGGEEFAMVLPRAGIEAAEARAERIRASFAEACYFIEGRQINATVSCGLSVSVNGEETLSELLKHADLALYRAKAGGRNRVRTDHPKPDESQRNVIRVA